jgi:hypothetical protein
MEVNYGLYPKDKEQNISLKLYIPNEQETVYKHEIVQLPVET